MAHDVLISNSFSTSPTPSSCVCVYAFRRRRLPTVLIRVNKYKCNEQTSAHVAILHVSNAHLDHFRIAAQE